MIEKLSYPRLLSKLFNKVPITQTRQSKKKTTSGIIKLPRLKFIQDSTLFEDISQVHLFTASTFLLQNSLALG